MILPFHESPFLGDKMYKFMDKLFPICRSLTGPGVRKTLNLIKEILPKLNIHEVRSGTKVFDWCIPDEWIIRDGFIADENGHKIVDFNVNNLHVIGYSEKVDKWLKLNELNKHLHSLVKQPEAIPYVTSYYEKQWGFCLSHHQRESLKPGNYRVVIDSDHKPGVLNYAELILQGKTNEEILLSTYICHPSMANNELSGPVVLTQLAEWLTSLKDRRYTYRIIFIPETIGSILYLSKHFEHLKMNTIAGFNITCVGDNRCYSYLPSRNGKTLSDDVAKHVLKHIDKNFLTYTWLDRGSDERQYCAPGIDLPIASIMRSKFGEYPEYHTSLDDMSFVTPEGLQGGYNALCRSLWIMEQNVFLKSTVLGEPQLGKRGLYPNLSTKKSNSEVRAMMDLISYCDGSMSLLQIAELIEKPFWELAPIAKILIEKGLLRYK